MKIRIDNPTNRHFDIDVRALTIDRRLDSGPEIVNLPPGESREFDINGVVDQALAGDMIYAISRDLVVTWPE